MLSYAVLVSIRSCLCIKLLRRSDQEIDAQDFSRDIESGAQRTTTTNLPLIAKTPSSRATIQTVSYVQSHALETRDSSLPLLLNNKALCCISGIYTWGRWRSYLLFTSNFADLSIHNHRTQTFIHLPSLPTIPQRPLLPELNTTSRLTIAMPSRLRNLIDAGEISAYCLHCHERLEYRDFAAGRRVLGELKAQDVHNNPDYQYLLALWTLAKCSFCRSCVTAFSQKVKDYRLELEKCLADESGAANEVTGTPVSGSEETKTKTQKRKDRRTCPPAELVELAKQIKQLER
jgi:hypothetical protein